jgi:DNA-binding YbaB/EbfC family protein
MNLGNLGNLNLGNLNLGDLMKQAQHVQEEMQRVQDELRRKTVSAESGAGMVKVVVTGAQELVSLTVEPHLLTPDNAQMLQDLVVAAVNKGLQESRAMAETEIKSLTGMLPKLPGLPL